MLNEIETKVYDTRSSGLNFSGLSRYYLSSAKCCEDHTRSFQSVVEIHVLIFMY